jgi:hypothetical protein
MRSDTSVEMWQGRGTASKRPRLLSIIVPEIDRLRRNSELAARRKRRRVLFAVTQMQRYTGTLSVAA